MTPLLRSASLAAAAILLALTPITAQTGIGPSAESLFADASAKESAVRRALAAAHPEPTVLRAVRTVVQDYEAFVRLYPTDGSADDALWRAALLSSDAFRIFADGQERSAAVRMLQALGAQYPSSRFAKQGPPLIAELSVLPVKHTTPDTPADAPLARAVANRTVGFPTPVATSSSAPAPAPAVAATATELKSETTTPAKSAPAPSQTSRTAATRKARPAPAPAARRTAAPQIATIQDIRRVVLSDVVRVIIELDREVTFRDERLEKPTRVFVDLPATTTVARLRDQTIRFDEDTDLVRQVRIGRHPKNTTRVVLDAMDVTSYSVYPLYNPFRLVIDCARVAPPADANAPAVAAPTATTSAVPSAAPAAAPPALLATSAKALTTPPVPAPPAPGPAIDRVGGRTALPPAPSARPAALLIPRRMNSWGLMPQGPHSAELAIRESQIVPVLDSTTARQTIKVPEVRPNKGNVEALLEPDDTPVVVPDVPIPAAILPPARNLDGGISLARQLGMGVSRIVIDPGHGGHDPGTKGGGNNEAEVVLDVALRLEKLLRAQPGIDVVLTRRGNDFVPLQERTAIANREGADLFLSIHANASSVASAHGVETYFLNFASNLSAAAVAARENAAAGQAMNQLPDVVRAIALNNKLDESKDFATHVQRELVAKLRPSNRGLRDLGVKQAPFQVLIGAAMPSVLAEISFLTNAQESRLLKQTAYRQKIADALYSAIRKYQATLGVATLAKQPS